MYRFWDSIIEPVLELLQPKSIVEIGSDQGKNTHNLLEFCKRQGATLYAIDPLPKFDVAAWQEQYGERFVFYQSLSLNAIPKIDRFDAVLIDGDHNWYTVFNELKLIEKQCVERGQHFPLIMLHDIGWPYGRRDLYYNPENIPDAYRKPYAKKGIRPGSPELVDDGGLNPHLFNSIYENNFQSGVLTAVEDFTRETEQDLEFVYIPGHHGLGVLIPAWLKECNREFAEFVNAFTSPVVVKHVEKIEASRVDAEIKKLEQQAVMRAKEAEVSELRERLSESERALTEMREQVAEVKSELDRERITWHEERQRLEVERVKQRVEAGRFREELEQQQAVLRAKEAEVSELRERLSESERALAEMREQVAALRGKEAEVAKLKQQLNDKERALAEKDRQLLEFKDKVNRQAQDIEKLTVWVEQMKTGVSRLLNTRRWKVGNALGELQRKMLFKRRQPMVTDSIENIYQDFQKWKRDRKGQLEEVNRTGDSATSFSIEQSSSSGSVSTSDDVTQLRHWLEQLEHGMNRLLRTRRWKIGNAIGFVSSVFRGSVKSPLASDHMREIFLQFRNWSPQLGKENSDTQKLARWIEQLQQDYEALLNSRRWKIGDRIVSLANRLFLRKKSPMVTDHIKTIFSKFKGWQEIHRYPTGMEKGQKRAAIISPRPDKKIDYAEWIARNDTLSNDDRVLIRKHIASFQSRPKFSILMPVYNTQPPYLREAIDSVVGQLYEDWELCVVDDASTSSEIRRIMEEYAYKDARIKPYFRQTNGGISACTNTALKMASGDWTVLMDHDGVLSEHALYLVGEAINSHPDAVIIYSDEDHIDEKGRRFAPYFKPDWDYDLFLGQNLINHLGVYRADLARRVGGFREGFEESQDWDFALRVLEAAPNAKVHHIPFILYHWRQTDKTFSKTSLARALDAAQRAVNEHFKRTGQAARAIPVGHSSYLRIKRDLPAKRPLVSIIIPTKDQCQLLRSCIDGLLNRTDYKPVEIVIVDNGTSAPDALAFLAGLRSYKNVKVVKDPGPFNFSRLVNLGVAASSGEVCILLNNDTNVINSDWLDEMVSHTLRPEVGAVGAKLYYANDKLQHGGVILGLGGVAGHAHRYVPRQSPGYFGRLRLTYGLSCVTAACLATRREVYDHVGGFDEQNLAVSFNDVDFCLRVRQAGYKIIWTPNAELYHYESISRGDPNATPEKSARDRAERAYMREQWASVLDNDPYYNPNLSLDSSFELSATPRVRKSWLAFAATQWDLDPNHNLEQKTAQALLMAALQRLDKSVAQRLTRIDVYKGQIAKYAAARATRNSQPKDRERIVIYTAISGGYDSIKLPEQLDPRFDYVLFTDTPAPDTGVWQICPITYFSEDVIRVARYVKTHPHLLLDDYDLAIWIDANIMILGDVYPLVEDFRASGKAVAAVPHPLRKSVYEEFEACIRQKRDDVKIMKEQLARYKRLGFKNDDLIESNFMMFNLRDERVRSFLDTWWAEIDRYSKRDQLSLNYALAQHSLELHWLTKRPNSIRNHPVFAMVPHDNGKGPASELIDALQVSFIDPYTGPPYSDLRDHRITVQRHRRIDIVVCVHNALEEVKLCLESIRRARNSEYQKLIIIDDGSDQSTARYLEDFASSASWVELHRNEHARGYTKAANQGLAASIGELVILLNSDTIVTDGWVEKMADAVFSTPGAGIVGPMSNAASHQSIPEHRGSKEQTAINELPPGLTAEDMNRYCEQWTVADMLPRVPLVHGFCFGVTREVVNTIGLFDDHNFPKGYGEENDYCFRAVDAGFSLVVATHTYVFHAKSKSYPDSERVNLMKAASEALERKYGRPRIHRAVRSMQENPFFVDLRQRARALMKNDVPPSIEVQDIGRGTTTTIKNGKKSILAIVPWQSNGYPEGSGYIRVVKPLQHASLSGVFRLSLAGKDREEFRKGFDALLIQRDAVKSPNQAEKIVDHCRKNKIRLIYEIDDDLLHLPETHPAAGRYSPAIREAMQTIIRHSDAVTVSTTPLKERLTVLNKNIFVLPNALDESLWLPADDPRWSTQRSEQVRILYMGTSTHDDDLVLVGDAIKRLKEKYGGRITFTCIGGFSKNGPEMARVLSVPKWASTYPEFAKWMARLSHHYDIAIAPLCDTEFNRCKSYIKYLDYGICGFAVVLSDVQPYRDIVRHGETGMLVENTTESWYEVLCTLIEDPGLRYNLGRNARENIIAHHTLVAQAKQRQRIWSEILS